MSLSTFTVVIPVFDNEEQILPGPRLGFGPEITTGEAVMKGDGTYGVGISDQNLFRS